MLKSSIVVMWASRGKKENNWISLSSLLINLDFLKIAQVLTSRKWKLAPTFKMYHFVFCQGITAQNWGYKIFSHLSTYQLLLSIWCCTHFYESDSTKNILNFQTEVFLFNQNQSDGSKRAMYYCFVILKSFLVNKERITLVNQLLSVFACIQCTWLASLIEIIWSN